ncbi:hypothetical protein GCM10023322_46080 [Rugosimonospora acidiphila]|uniref:Uncharacterized protein n=1 Tax=Rugosimonospora acidiphila TaxID=556531 RepID=A0ABP9S3H4_9ACTN
MAGRIGSQPDALGGDQQKLHEQVEHIAMPDYDWVGEPIAALADAVFAVASHHPHLRRRHRAAEAPAQETQAS